MSQPVKDHIEALLLFAGLSGLLSALYRFGLPASLICRHHEALTSFFAWASRGGWLDSMQSAVRLVLRAMTFVYGPPSGRSSIGVRRFLTMQAWRMSAWIASLILFFVPMAVLSVSFPFLAQFDGSSAKWLQSATLVGLTALLAGVFYLNLRQVRTLRARESGRRGFGLLETGLRASAIIGVPFCLMLVGIIQGRSSPAFDAGDYFASFMLSLTMAGIIFCFVQALKEYAFAAPAAFIMQVMIGALIFGPVMFVIGGTHDYLVGVKAAPSLAALIFQFPTAVLASLIVVAYWLGKLKGRRLTASFGVLVLAEMMALILAGWLLPGQSVPTVARIVISVPLLFFVPYVLALYAAVYSNSLPDWISIALTRHILGNAGSSTSLRRFAMWLAVDALAVALFVLATFLILVSVFTLCSAMVEFAIRIAEFPDFDGVRRYFSGSWQALPVGFELARHGNFSESMRGGGPEHAGAMSVLVLVLLSATSLIPTLLNALVLVALIAGRAAATLLGRPLKALHGLLLIDEGAAPDKQALSLWRSSGIFGTVGAFLYVLGYSFVAALS